MPVTKDGREFEIECVLTVVPKVDVSSFAGNYKQSEAAIDEYYSNQV